MKANKINRKRSRFVPVAVGLGVLALLLVGLLVGSAQLRRLWREPCRVTDPNEQIMIASGRMVKADVIAEIFGLRLGANLAEIDYAARRAEALRRIPNLRALTVSRILPDKVAIQIEEREPIARLNLRGSRGETGKTVDAEGVVFLYQRGTRALPVIREAAAPGTACGQRLTGRTRAALQLIEACRDPAFQELGILEVDVSKPDFLLATLGTTYSRAKIAWAEMDENTPASHANLLRQLNHLRLAIRSHVGDGAVIWNATDLAVPGRIWADTKGTF